MPWNKPLKTYDKLACYTNSLNWNFPQFVSSLLEDFFRAENSIFRRKTKCLNLTKGKKTFLESGVLNSMRNLAFKGGSDAAETRYISRPTACRTAVGALHIPIQVELLFLLPGLRRPRLFISVGAIQTHTPPFVFIVLCLIIKHTCKFSLCYIYRAVMRDILNIMPPTL